MMKEQIAQIETQVLARFSQEAQERYGRVKLAHPDRAYQALAILGQALQNQKFTIINDQHLKDVLAKIK